MDVGVGEPAGKLPDTSAPDTPVARGGGLLDGAQIEEILRRRQRRELRIARGFRECRGLSAHQIEVLYQETVLALLHRPYEDEKHLCDALRTGIKRRALNLYRDEQRRAEILADSADAMHAIQQAQSARESPEQIVLAREDRFLIAEFLAELTPREREVFELVTEGMKYNRIAKALKMPENEARSTAASCERKRERFQILHDHGRLCGYRSLTIRALLDGAASTEQLVALAAAHLEACVHCRAEHKISAARLRQAFQEQAAALLPPTLATRLDRSRRVSLHVRVLAARLRPEWVSLGQGGARERAAALLAGAGASTKLAAGLVTVAVIAGAGITATRALEHHPSHPATRPVARAGVTPHPTQAIELAQPSPAPSVAATLPHASHPAPAQPYRSPGHVVATQATARVSTGNRREPGGFAYLGVPDSSTPAPAPAPQPAQTASQTGGPFSP
jgi:RNA polymerase sigma factor (sigma-70 family)